MDNSAAWEKEYFSRGPLWGGSAHPLPRLPSGSRVLELGCGNGKALPAMLYRKWDITAADFSLQAISLCRQHGGGSVPVHFAVADARRSPFRDRSFDAVFAQHIIGHMDSPARCRAAGEVQRLLRPGGLFLFCEFSSDDFRSGSGTKTEEGSFLRGNGIVTHYFTREEVFGLFPDLMPLSVRDHRWQQKVRGRNLVRSEIIALFQKKA